MTHLDYLIFLSKMAATYNYYCPGIDRQTGGWTDLPVYQGRYQYGFGYPVYRGRPQYGQGFGDVLRGIWRFFRPVALSGAKTLLKAGSEALTDGATVKEVLSNTLKPTVGALLNATAEQVANRLNADKPAAAPPPGSAPTYAVPPQIGSKKRKRRAVYKMHKTSLKRKAYSRP